MMNLRNVVLWFFLILTLATTADAEPATKADLQTLELKLSNQMTEMDKRLTKQMTDLEKRIDKRFTEQSEQIHALEKRIDRRFTEQGEKIHKLETRLIALEIVVRESNKLLANSIKEMDTRLSASVEVLYWAISALIGVVLAVIAVPQLLGYLQARRERADMQKQIDDQRVDFETQVEEMKRRIAHQDEKIEQQDEEIEELRSRRILPPS